MTQVPARLVYTDSGGSEQIIGEFQPQNPTEGNISTFTVEENARNYRRVIIEGGPTLEDNMPVVLSEFQGDEPEIRVEIDDNLDGNWTTRQRVYPEESGTTDNRGRYKNKNLWGFKKYYGQQDVDTGTVSTNLTDALDALLPTGYTARYPSGETPPNVSNYTFNGSRQQGFRELQRYYDHFIMFTDETDGGGNYYVDLQPVGYGGTQFSLTRTQDPINYDYWKKNDLRTVISKVKVIGKDSNGQKVERVTAAGTNTGTYSGDSDVDNYAGLPEPDKKRKKTVHVDYTITETEADSIGENIIQAEGVEQGALDTEIRTSSNLNDSVGIVDNDRDIDAEYTVVKQKDFFHEGVSYFSFEFENDATEKQVDKWTEHDFERSKVYPSSTTNVGPLNTEDVTDSYDSHNSQNHPHDVGGKDSTNDGGSSAVEESETQNNLGGITAGSTADAATFNASGSFTDGADIYYSLQVGLSNSPSNFLTPETEVVWDVWVENTDTSTIFPTNKLIQKTFHAKIDIDADGSPENHVQAQLSGMIHIPENTAFSEYKLRVTPDTDVAVIANVKYISYDEHSHTIEFQSDRAEDNSDNSLNNTNASDSTAGDTTSLQTDTDSINTAQEDDTSRS